MLFDLDRKTWLRGRKIHGVLDNHPSCRNDLSLAAGYCFNDTSDLRKITCKICRKVLKNERIKNRCIGLINEQRVNMPLSLAGL